MSDDMEEARRFLQLMLLGAALEGGIGLSPEETSKSAYKLSDYIMVAAIDFGTTFSGYAFSFKNEKEDIKMNKNWGAEAGFTSYKTPTCLLLTAEKEFMSFGYEAQQTYAEMVEKEEQNCYYFQRFKMKLHKTKTLNKDTTVTASNGKTLPALDIFSMALRYLKDHVISTVTKSVTSGIDETMIRWVITVPAIWSDASKQFMRQAAHQAELIKDIDSGQLVIALEPEVASLFIRKLDINHFKRGEDHNIQPGTKYLVLDAGGGTLDVTAHEVQEFDKVKELTYATGDALGGTKIDEEFIKLIEKVFGKDFIDNFRNENPSQWMTMLLEFEKKKRLPHGRKSVNIQIPWTFGKNYEKVKGTGIDKAIKNCGVDGVKFGNGVMIIEIKLVEEMFRPAISAIVKHIQQLLTMPQLKDIEYFFCVGGFNESTILQDALVENFGNDVKIILPTEASLAVVKGAVQFGHKPDSISSRVSSKTYGVQTMTQFIPFLHDKSKGVICNGQIMCRDVFLVYVRKGEDVPVGYSKTIEFSPVTEDQDGAKVHIYSVDRSNVEYVTDEGVEHHGQVYVEWPGSGVDRQLKITMTFGGTEIKVSAVTFPGENIADTKINFFAE